MLIDFDYINKMVKNGLKLRFDIGLSSNMPNTINWLENYNDVFVIGIEPHPENFNSCRKLLEYHPNKSNCYLIEAAIDNVQIPTKKVFYGLGGEVTNFDAGTSSLKKPIGRFKNSIDQVYNVDTLSLSYILDNIDCNYIDIIKTDTQGNDLNVLKSLRDHLSKVISITAEYDESDDYEDANTGNQLDDFLSQNNFEKYEEIYQPLRDNKIEDCKYRNKKYINYTYGNELNFLITEETEKQNPYTWSNGNIFEIDLILEFIKYIKDDFTILDIGAQSGCFSLLSKFYPNTRWHSFEPDWWNRCLLTDNLKLNFIENVTVYEEALANKVESSFLRICHSNRGLNTLGKNRIRFSDEDSFDYEVKTNTLDNLFLNTKVDLIKIDTEGSEYDILLGGIETIKKYKPKIILEYYEPNLLQCDHTIVELHSLIEDLNYEIVWNINSNIMIQSK